MPGAIPTLPTYPQLNGVDINEAVIAAVKHGMPLPVPNIVCFRLVNPVAASNAAFVNAKALPDAAESWIPGVTSGVTAYSIDYAQTLRFVCSAAQSGNLTVYGTDILDNEIQETVALSGTTAVFTTKAFKTVTKFDVPAKAGSETITIGTHQTASKGRYGLPAPMYNFPMILSESESGGTGPAVTGYWVAGDPSATSTTGGDPRGLWKPNSAPDGSRDFCIIYLSS